MTVQKQGERPVGLLVTRMKAERRSPGFGTDRLQSVKLARCSLAAVLDLDSAVDNSVVNPTRNDSAVAHVIAAAEIRIVGVGRCLQNTKEIRPRYPQVESSAVCLLRCGDGSLDLTLG